MVSNILSSSSSEDEPSSQLFLGDRKTSSVVDGLNRQKTTNTMSSASRSSRTNGGGSFHDVLVESLAEASRFRGGLSGSNLVADTMKEIGTAASQTIASLREWSGGAQENSDKQNTIWKYAAPSKDDDCDDDENTVGTFDTIQEENNMIRRLGSWNTINTMETTGTFEVGTKTGEAECADDDGNAIDPTLLEKTHKSRGKRRQRRKKIVKFDYPPVKSMKQFPRHDPENLPNLFFTEQELDQIEGDRYSTMSTDDIEIVAVTSKKSESEISRPNDKGEETDTGKSESGTGEEICNESRLCSTKERQSTPLRRRKEEDENENGDDMGTQKAHGKNGRMVKGVQIFLRERSMGV
eukprot:scaffold5529_cov117-Cylindrotheca_fusiformis.AAC.2